MFTNLTPHDIVLFDDNDNEIARFPSQGSLRLTWANPSHFICEIDGVKINSIPSGPKLDGIPENANDIIVSQMVLPFVPAHIRAFSPGTDPQLRPLRDEKGQIRGVRCLVMR